MDAPRWNVFGILYAAIIAVTAIMLVLSIPYGTYAIFYTHLSASYNAQTLAADLPFYIGLLTVAIPVSPSFGALFLALTVVYCAMLAFSAYGGGGFGRAMLDSAREGPQALLRNPLSATIVLLGATLFATVILQDLQTAAGVGTGGLSGDSFLLFMDLQLSPLIEEIGYRFFLIGVPLAVLLLVTRPKTEKVLRTLWRPSAAWADDPTIDPEHMQFNKSTLRNFTYFLIAFSSILFGLAHYLSGAGWEVGKISEAALDGVALAYLYVRYGLHASIIFHWAVDYASNAFAFYGQGVYGISWTASSNWSNIPTLVIILFVGVPGLILVANVALKWAIRPRAQTAPYDSSRPLNPDQTGGTVQRYLSDNP